MLRLRKWRLSDVELVREASLDPYVASMLGLRRGCGARAARNWIGRASGLVIELDGQGLGEVGLQPDAVGYSAGLWYWVLARARGQGIATRAAQLVCQRAGSMVLTAYVSERNLASLRVLQSLGFERGARTSQYAGYPGARDTYSYFRLPSK